MNRKNEGLRLVQGIEASNKFQLNTHIIPWQVGQIAQVTTSKHSKTVMIKHADEMNDV